MTKKKTTAIVLGSILAGAAGMYAALKKEKTIKKFATNSYDRVKSFTEGVVKAGKESFKSETPEAEQITHEIEVV